MKSLLLQLQMHKRFIIRLTIFCFPFAFIFIGMLIIGITFREAVPHNIVLLTSQERNIVYRPIWLPINFAEFKLEGSLFYRPNLLIVGSSRAVHVSSEIFNRQPHAVYNAAFDAAVIHDMWQMIRILDAEHALPKLIILQMNYPDFNADMPNTTNLNIQAPTYLSGVGQVWNSTLWVGRRWRIVLSAIQDTLSVEQTSSLEFWGLLAITTHIGYLADGSEYNANLSPELAQRHYEVQYQEFQARTGNFRAGNRVHEENLWKLREILRIAAANQAEVIGYFPPYRANIYEPMVTSGDYTYIPEARSNIRALFEEFNYSFFDFSDIYSVNGQDEELYDAWHPGQRLNVRIFMAIAEAVPRLSSDYIDINALAGTLVRATDPFYIFMDHP
jgi:hypothetical protein